MAIKNIPNFREDIGTKINWSEPREQHAKNKIWGRDPNIHQAEMHLQNANSKKPVFGENKKRYQINLTNGKTLSNSLGFDKDNNGEKGLIENAYVTKKVVDSLNNTFNSNQLTDEEKIDYMKDVANKNGISFDKIFNRYFSGKTRGKPGTILADGDNDDYFNYKNNIYEYETDLLKNIDDPSLRRVNSDLYANQLRLNDYAQNGNNAKSKNWYKDQVNVLGDYISTLERNNRALSGGKYYLNNDYKNEFNTLTRALKKGQDIRPLLKKWNTNGDDNYYADTGSDLSDAAAYEMHEYDDSPQADLNESYKFNTSPGRYRKQMDASKRLKELDNKWGSGERLSQNEIDEYQKLSRLLKR